LENFKDNLSNVKDNLTFITKTRLQPGLQKEKPVFKESDDSIGKNIDIPK
jgi:hypothetical protein